jgi:AMP-polyphosphate phosphotransferase
MLERAERGERLARDAYERALPGLREALVDAQYALSQQRRTVLTIILSGIEGGGRSESANTLNAWLDPRYIRTMAFGKPSAHEQSFPPDWRYWQAMQPRGRIGLFTDAWYTEPIRAAVNDHATRFTRALARINAAESMLACDEMLLLKIWIHLSDADAQRRLEELAREQWRLEPLRTTRRHVDAYLAHRARWEELLRDTSTAAAPWFIVDGADPRHRAMTIGKLVLRALRRGVEPPQRVSGTALATEDTPPPVPLQREQAAPSSAGDYEAELARWQHRLAEATRSKRFRRHSLVLVFEGSDAAGKGGTIRRVTGALDARQYVTVPISAPSEDERAYPWLWRFWRHVPPQGGIAIFDRSWYGRVLVERVEGFASVADWQRAYAEINAFEQSLARGNAVICKFWLQVDKAEQLVRFRAREKTAFKQFKITPDDWRNRARWDDYRRAVDAMVARTSTVIAPWTRVDSDDKRAARVAVLRAIVERLDEALD